MAETPKPPAPTSSANSHSQKFWRIVMKTVASGVDTIMICSVTVMLMTYIKARLLVIPLNTFKDESPSFLELISLKTCMTGHKVRPYSTTHRPHECVNLHTSQPVIAHDQDRDVYHAAFFDNACVPGSVKATSIMIKTARPCTPNQYALLEVVASMMGSIKAEAGLQD